MGFAPGGAYDIAARLMGQSLADRLGQPFIVENRPGAGGTIATEAVVRAPADGYTLLLVGAAGAISASLYDKLNFDLVRDIAPVAAISREPHIILVHPSVSASTVPDFAAYAKANPANVSYGSGGNGTVTHLAGELFKMMMGINMLHVPYRGAAPALNDLLGGQVQVMFAPLSASIAHIKAGKLRALAVTTATRSDTLPDLPTVGESVAGYEVSTWSGFGAPRTTPAEVVERLNNAVNAGLDDAKLRARLADLGGTALAGSPADFGQLIAGDTEKWGKVIRTAKIKAE